MRASTWNRWTEEEQLAGHLRGRALAEWNLLSPEEKSTYAVARDALRARLDPGSRVLAAQDFRHAIQRDDEPVADYIQRGERCFQIAYGHDSLSLETRETILYGKLKEGLKFSIMKSPTVSRCQSYKDLRIAAKNEEKRLLEFWRHQQYLSSKPRPAFDSQKKTLDETQGQQQETAYQLSRNRPRRCHLCGSTSHLKRDCKATKTESTVQPKPQQPKPQEKSAGTKLVQSTQTDDAVPVPVDPMQFLESDKEDDSTVSTVRVKDKGSKPQMAVVDVQGVQTEGIIDTGADITIMGPELFKMVAAVAHLKKSHLKPPAKVTYTYDRRTFKLDGKLELDITFQGWTMLTPVYLRMEAQDSLLLSEGVCHQLGIVTYHPSITLCHPKRSDPVKPSVSSVCVSLVQSVSLLPWKASMVTVQVEEPQKNQLLLMEPSPGFTQENNEVCFGNSLVKISDDGHATTVLTNPTGFTQKLEKGICIGQAMEAFVVEPGSEVMEERDVAGVLAVPVDTFASAPGDS